MTGPLVVGVDGGKSKTVCLLADADGRVLGAGRAGSSDKYYVLLPEALDTVAGCVAEAAGEAGVDLPVAAGCFGLAGADWPEDFTTLQAGLAVRGLAQQVLVKNDMHIALQANASYGVVISLGTHTAAAIRTPQGEEWHAGWFAVEGPGGVWIGQQVLWAVFHAYDGRGEPTRLTKLVLEATGRPDVLTLLRELSEGKLDDGFMATLAPLAFQAQHRFADPVATEIITRAGKEASRWVTGLLSRYELLEADMPVVLSGGLLRGEGSLLLDTFSAAVHAQAPGAIIQLASRQPVIGALLYAYQACGIAVTPELIAAIEATAPGEDFYRTA